VANAESITVENLARVLRVSPALILQQCRRNGLNASTPRSLLKPNERELVEHWFGRSKPVPPKPKKVAPKKTASQSNVRSPSPKAHGGTAKEWARLIRARDAGSPMSGRVVEVVKGGLILDLGVRAFLPASQVDRKPVADLAALIGSLLEVHVVEVDAAKQRLVVSRRSVVRLESEQHAAAFFASVAPGDVRTAAVKATRPTGIMVDINGVEMFIRENQLQSPPSSHQVGEQIDVAVCDVDQAKRSVVLSTRLGREDKGPSTVEPPHGGPIPDNPGAGIVGVGETLLLDVTRFDELALGTTLNEACRLGHRQVALVLDGHSASGKAEIRKVILSGRLANIDRDGCRQTPNGFVVALRVNPQ
jgi:hypothetical protein